MKYVRWAQLNDGKTPHCDVECTFLAYNRCGWQAGHTLKEVVAGLFSNMGIETSIMESGFTVYQYSTPTGFHYDFDTHELSPAKDAKIKNHWKFENCTSNVSLAYHNT